MALKLQKTVEGIDWKQVHALFEKVGWGNRTVSRLKRAFEQSGIVRFAFEDGELVGVGRVLTDGEFYATLYDIVVPPEQQGKGIGRDIVLSMLEDIEGLNWILLTSTPGNEPFYHRLGFRKQKTAMMYLKSSALVTPAFRNAYLEEDEE